MAKASSAQTAKMGHAKQKCSAIPDFILAGQKCITSEDSYIPCLTKGRLFDVNL